jgi:hypothetical protein
MTKIHMVITNGGDGSNGIQWVLDEDVLDKMEELADDGDESYASGDGLQTHKLVFPDDFDLNAWMKTNHITAVTMEDMDY